MAGLSVLEGLALKQTVKGGTAKGWKQRHLVLTLDSLEYYDKCAAHARCQRTCTLPLRSASYLGIEGVGSLPDT